MEQLQGGLLREGHSVRHKRRASFVPWCCRASFLPLTKKLNRALVLGLLACIGATPPALQAQDRAATGWTATPSLGFAAITRNGTLESGGMTILAEVDLHTTHLRWTVFTAIRGLGVSCSDGCDLGGRSAGVSVSYLRGPLGIGGGVGLLRRSAEWHLQPHGQVSLARGRFRVQLRLEVPRGVGGISIPALVGLSLPSR